MDVQNNATLHLQQIKAINTDTVHKICSGQVVLSLAVAVKELIENSLDAGATNIEIRFKNYGTELIEVSDNGSGVTEDNFAALTLKYHTSKLRDYSDLLGVSSFGFRGEALSSLCALSDLIITTRHSSAQYATKLEYDHKGNIVKKTPCSRQVGTTVSLSNLFSSLPVRQKEFHKNVKREFNKMTQLLYAYCLISLGVKITCTNQTSSNSKTVVVATQGTMSYKDNIACVFGLKQLQSILEITPEYASNIKDNIFKGLSQETEEADEQTIDDVEIDLSEDSNEADNTELKSSQDTINGSQKSNGYKNIMKPIKFTGFISSCAHGSGRSSTDRQFYFVNSRPCEPTKIIKVINEIYKQYNPNQYPFVFLNVNIERTSVDVNVTPDKRKVFLTKEKVILEVLKRSLLKLFESIPRTLKIETSMCKSSNNVKPHTDQPRIFNSFLQQFSSKAKGPDTALLDDKNIEKNELKRKATSMLDFISSKSMKKVHDEELSEESHIQDTAVECKENDIIIKEENETESPNYDESNMQLENESEDYQNSDITTTPDNQEIMYLEYTNKIPDTQIRKIDEVISEKAYTTVCKPKSSHSKCNISPSEFSALKKCKVVTDKEDLGKHNRKSINVKTSLEQIKMLAEMYHKSKNKSAPERVKFRSAINPVHNKKCEEELSKEISKDSFKEMVVIGQFNLGFIITRLDDDLFIIDQHATDEIYNFETLQKTTELTNQKLVVPQQLELTGVNEQILMDNLEIFKKNGFTFDINENAPPTKRVKLLTIPMSKNWIFGKEDIEELLFMLRESTSEYCRPSRVRAMFASRACRKSVMIGTALSKADMKKLVIHMSEIEKPWNCPHGRPTIRHLVNLAVVHTQD
ncbi:hypothetical protein ABMA28_004709 [Loxostege sticticalis]|uniref:Mismatch repair endonuclease PMS2 n=1 Tax=Loxostege sticticalis TaxID=481309 RepID=A0ABD0SUL6_LOXSC